MEDNINAEWTDEEVCRMVDEARTQIRIERTDSQAAKRGWTFEKLCDDIDVCISSEHRFGTDAFLLADFASPRHKDCVCDYCAGCGIVAFLMIRDFQPKYVAALEIQQQAVEQMNISYDRKSTLHIDIIHGDLKDFRGEKEFDLITCNPPYKINNTGIKNSSDAAAIARHEIMCTIDDVCQSAARNLKFGGRLCLCNRPERLCDVLYAMRKNGIEPKRLRTVQKTPFDPPWLILVEGCKGGKPFMTIEPPLYTSDGNGGYSAEMKRIYKLDKYGLEGMI